MYPVYAEAEGNEALLIPAILFLASLEANKYEWFRITSLGPSAPELAEEYIARVFYCLLTAVKHPIYGCYKTSDLLFILAGAYELRIYYIGSFSNNIASNKRARARYLGKPLQDITTSSLIGNGPSYTLCL
jgi:hypothetical protein